MQFSPKTIGGKFAMVISITVVIVGFSGFFAGSSLLTQVGALANDESLLQALSASRNVLIAFNKTRRTHFEEKLETCIKEKIWPRCTFGDVATTITSVDVPDPAASSGWSGETSYFVTVSGKNYQIKVDWPEYHPQFQNITDILATREHVTTLLPSLLRTFVLVFAGALFITALFGLGINYLLSRRISSRVAKLIAYTRIIGAGKTPTSPPDALGEDEVGTLATALHSMALDLEETRQRLILTEKMHSWQNVARKVAHEIKNPLTPITLVAAQLRRQEEKAPPNLKPVLNEAIQILEEETASLGRMVKEFSAFARLPDPKLQPDDLSDIITSFMSRNQSDTGPLLLQLNEPADYLLICDRGMLMQIFHNLVNNARLAKSPARVTVTFNLHRQANNLVLDVKDDGPGVPADLRSTLFDAYVTSRSTGEQEKGMGLGLTISRKIAHDHGGSLILKEASEFGSCFELTLPAATKGRTQEHE